MFGMNLKGFDAQGKPSGNQQQSGMNLMGIIYWYENEWIR